MRYIYILTFFFLGKTLLAQKPFDCGSAYFTVSDGNLTNIYKVFQNANKTLTTTFLVKADKDFNGVGYRRQDNLMYATSTNSNSDGTYNFYQIGANGKTKLLKKMPFDKTFSYYAGDVSVDGKYYVALANGGSPNKLYLVNLLDPNYSFQELTFPIGTNINSPDIAFSPDGSRLYAYNNATKKLLEIDYLNGKIAKEYDNTSSVTGNFSGMWAFDCALFGYNRQYEGYLRCEIEGKGVEKIGNLTQVNAYKPEYSQSIDGCSCPPPVKLFKFAKKTINPDTCITEIKFYFAIDNKCGLNQNNVNFSDVLPEEFIITKIDKNPFGGIVKQGIGGHTLLIDNMNIPNTQDTMVITTRLKPILDKSFFKNQAFLKNVKLYDGTPVEVKSDDPTTAEYLDSTLVKAPLFVKFSRDTVALCPDGKAKIKPKVEGTNLTFKWNTGEKTAEITVKKEGIYSVTVTSDCEIKIDTQVVINAPLSLEIGNDSQILPGDSVLIFPNVKAYNDITNYLWITTPGANLKYKNKATNVAKPNEEEVRVTLLLTDDQGCTISDFLTIKMNRNVFIPNVFSPDDDAINDVFYIFTEAKAQIDLLQIFDQWGNLVFEKTDCPSNDPACGWDGIFRNKKANIGVYTYRAIVGFLDGKKVKKKGDVTLAR